MFIFWRSTWSYFIETQIDISHKTKLKKEEEEEGNMPIQLKGSYHWE